MNKHRLGSVYGRQGWIFFVSRRWFSARRETGGSPAAKFAAAGIAAGVAALIVVLAVMNGFQSGFIDPILEISSFHLRIASGHPGLSERDKAFVERLGSDKAVRSVLPFAETRCLIANDSGRGMPLSLMLLPKDAARRDPGLVKALGLDYEFFTAVSTSAAADPASSDGRKTDGIVLGAEIADYLGLGPGDDATIMLVTSDQSEGLQAATIQARVLRVFRSGYYNFDYGLGFMPLDAAAPGSAAMAGIGAPELIYGVKLKNRFEDAAFVDRIVSGLGLKREQAQSWREYNRVFFGALRMEKTMLMFLVGLVFLVVGVNIFHAMRRAVAERMEDIAVLRALGCGAEDIRRAFLFNGLAVGLGGALVGLVLGLLVAVNINQVFGLAEWLINALYRLAVLAGGAGRAEDFRVFSPQYFYLMEVPVRIYFPETFFVTAVAAGSAALAAAAAATGSSRLKPAEVLRYE